MTDIVSGANCPISMPDVIIRNKGLEVIIEECIDFWVRNFPEEYTTFVDHDMKRQRDLQSKETGMTVGGNFMLKGLIPPTLKKIVGHMLEKQDVLDHNDAKHWEKNIEMINVFFKLFRVGCINEKSALR